jgi:hypothetical protein
MKNKESDWSVLVRIIPAVAFLAVVARVGCLTLFHLSDAYLFHTYHHKPGTFGYVYDFGIFRLHDPGTSFFIIACCLGVIWGCVSLIRKRADSGYFGIIVGVICLTLLVVGDIRGFDKQ